MAIKWNNRNSLCAVGLHQCNGIVHSTTIEVNMVYSAYEYHFLRKVQWVCTSTMVARCLAVLYWTMKINRVEYYTHFRMWRWVYVNALAYASSSSGRGSVSVCVRVLNGHNDQSYWSHKSNVHTLLNNNYSKIHIKILLVNFLRRRWRGYVDVHLEWLWSHLTACIRHHTFNRLWRLWIALNCSELLWRSSNPTELVCLECYESRLTTKLHLSLDDCLVIDLG